MHEQKILFIFRIPWTLKCKAHLLLKCLLYLFATYFNFIYFQATAN